MSEKQVMYTAQVGTAPAARIPGGPQPARLSAQPAVAESVKFLPLYPEARLPVRGTELAAGYDLHAPRAVVLQPGERTRIPLGFALGLPADLHGRIESRSSLALKGLVVLTGVIDADYRGEVAVIMQNFSNEVHEFAPGDRVAQLVLRRTEVRWFEPVSSLDSTERGAGGFGSTGR